MQVGSNDRCVMRIPLPVQPHLKTMSEVASIEYVRQETDINSPAVLKFEALSQNELGSEWILMSHISGSQIGEQWRSIPWSKKELIIRNIVSCLARLFRKRFSHQANLYATADLQRLPWAAGDAIPPMVKMPGFEPGFFLGQVVEQPFFWGNHLHFDVNRGPFESGRDWLHAVLQLYVLGADTPVTVIDDSEDEEDSDSNDEPSPLCSPEAIKVRAQRLMDLQPAIFAANTSEMFVLHHHDLHENNIFVDDNHDISGVIDWECLPTVPLWAACEIPKFLQTKLSRHVSPTPDRYLKVTLDDGTEDMDRLYYKHLADYEKTQLRTVFLEEMQRVCPDWVDVYKNNKPKATFREAVALFGDKSNAKILDEWLGMIEEHGDAPSIATMLTTYEQDALDSNSV